MKIPNIGKIEADIRKIPSDGRPSSVHNNILTAKKYLPTTS